MSQSEIQDFRAFIRLVKKYGKIIVAFLSFISTGVIAAAGWGRMMQKGQEKQGDELVAIRGDIKIARNEIAEIRTERREALKEWQMWREVKNIKDNEQDTRIAHVETRP